MKINQSGSTTLNRGDQDADVESCDYQDLGKPPQEYVRKDSEVYNKKINSSSILDDMLLSSFTSQVPNQISVRPSIRNPSTASVLLAKADEYQKERIRNSLAKGPSGLQSTQIQEEFKGYQQPKPVSSITPKYIETAAFQEFLD